MKNGKYYLDLNYLYPNRGELRYCVFHPLMGRMSQPQFRTKRAGEAFVKRLNQSMEGRQ